MILILPRETRVDACCLPDDSAKAQSASVNCSDHRKMIAHSSPHLPGRRPFAGRRPLLTPIPFEVTLAIVIRGGLDLRDPHVSALFAWRRRDFSN